MSEQTWDKEHPFSPPSVDDWILVQGALASRDTRIVKLSQVQALGSRAIVPVNSVDDDYEVGADNVEELYGGVIFVTAPATITIPELPAGASFTIVTIGAVAITVQPQAADVIYLDGVALDAGDTIDNSSTAGDTVKFTAIGDGEIYASSGVNWTDAGTLVPPEVLSAVEAGGLTVTVTFDVAVFNADTDDGFVLTGSIGGDYALVYASGNATDTVVYNITGGPILGGQDLTLSYTQSVGGIEDAEGDQLESFSDLAVTS